MTHNQGRARLHTSATSSLLLVILTATVTFTAPATGRSDDAGRLTLEEAVSRALRGNPELQVFGLEQDIQTALATQAQRKPNPELELELENFAGSGGVAGLDAVEYTLTIGQLMERGGKRARRFEAARLQADLADWDYLSSRLDVMERTGRAFILVLQAQKNLDLTERMIEVAGQDLEAVKRRTEAGAASPIELTRAEVSLATAELDRSRRLLDLEAARNELAALWGDAEATFTHAVGTLDHIPVPPALETLTGRLEDNPDLARWQTEHDRRRANLSLQQAMGTVDLTARVGIRRFEETGDQAFVLGVSLPLAVHDRNQGNIRAAQYGIEQADRARSAAQLELRVSLSASYLKLQAAFKEITTLQEKILPAAQQAMTKAEDAYGRGLFSFTDVLAVRLNYFQLQERYVTAQTLYHLRINDLERFVAGPLDPNPSAQEQP